MYVIKFSELVHTSVDQCIIIKYLSREGVKLAEMLCRLTAQFAGKTLPMAEVYDWHKQFRRPRVGAE